MATNQDAAPYPRPQRISDVVQLPDTTPLPTPDVDGKTDGVPSSDQEAVDPTDVSVAILKMQRALSDLSDDEIDRRVTATVMGWGTWPIFPFSTQMAFAWEVLKEGLIKTGSASIDANMEDFGREPGDIAWVQIGQVRVLGHAPRAICHAALITWMLESPDDDPRA